MTCCQTTRYPKGWEPLPEVSQGQNQLVDKPIRQELQTNINRRLSMPPTYRTRVAFRVVGVALAVIGLTALILTLQGRLTSFPQDFLQFFHTINWLHVEIGAAIFVVLSGGALILIKLVQMKPDSLTHHDGGAFSGDQHWVAARYVSKEHGTHSGYIDKSTLDENGNGHAFMYIPKGEQEHYGVSIEIVAFTPVHMIGAIVYNILRIVVVPFYILCNLNDEHKKLSLKDIPNEIKKSLLRVVKAPFYAVAIIFAAIYSFFDPLNGRKLGASLERDWNKGMTRAEGFWSVRGPQSIWKLEGEWPDREWIGSGFSFYLAGCWQPIARVRYKNWKIVPEGESLSLAVIREKRLTSTKGEAYTVYDVQSTLDEHQRLLEELAKDPVLRDFQATFGVIS